MPHYRDPESTENDHENEQEILTQIKSKLIETLAKDYKVLNLESSNYLILSGETNLVNSKKTTTFILRIDPNSLPFFNTEEIDQQKYNCILIDFELKTEKRLKPDQHREIAIRALQKIFISCFISLKNISKKFSLDVHYKDNNQEPMLEIWSKSKNRNSNYISNDLIVAISLIPLQN